jgi:uncharacterized Rossmann fold enzyme
MNINQWNRTYKKIAEDLNINIKNDIKATKNFNEYLIKKQNNNDLDSLKNIIFNKEVVVFGAGPSLKKSIKKYNNFFKKKIKISADGATSALIESKIIPDIIVTDLDGKIDDQILSNSKGSIVLIHSHADNIKIIKKNINKFNNSIIGTTQIDSSKYPLINNFGGFTDGDRSVLLASYFKAKFIYLIGFDFNGKIGEYSNPEFKDHNLKIKKLKWCKKIIDLYVEKQKIKYLKI